MHSECIFMGLTDEGIDKWLFYFPALLFKEFFHFAKHKDYNSLQMHHTLHSFAKGTFHKYYKNGFR